MQYSNLIYLIYSMKSPQSYSYIFSPRWSRVTSYTVLCKHSNPPPERSPSLRLHHLKVALTKLIKCTFIYYSPAHAHYCEFLFSLLCSTHALVRAQRTQKRVGVFPAHVLSRHSFTVLRNT